MISSITNNLDMTNCLSGVINDTADAGIAKSLPKEEIFKSIEVALYNHLRNGGLENITFTAIPKSLVKPEVVTYHFLNNDEEFGRLVLELKGEVN